MSRHTRFAATLALAMLGTAAVSTPARAGVAAAKGFLDRLSSTISAAKSIEYESTVIVSTGDATPVTMRVHAKIRRNQDVHISLSNKAFDDPGASLIISNATGVYEFDPALNEYTVSPPGSGLIVRNSLLRADWALTNAHQFFSASPYEGMMPSDADTPLTLTRGSLDIAGAVLLTSVQSGAPGQERLCKIWVDTAANTPRRIVLSVLASGHETEIYREDFQSFTLNANFGDDFAWSTPTGATPAATTLKSPSKRIGDADLAEEDIGSPDQKGYSVYSDGVYAINGVGDFFGNTDNFHYLHQSMNGDFVLTTRFLGSQSASERGARAGIAVRDGLTPNASGVAVVAIGNDHISIQSRPSAGVNTNSTVIPISSVPIWLRMVRTGSLFTGFYSTDGANWQRIGHYEMVLPTVLEVGLGAGSDMPGTTCPAAFDNVSFRTAAQFEKEAQ